MHKPESVLENETHKILLDFAIQTDDSIYVNWPDLVLIDKKKRAWHLADFAFPSEDWVKRKESQ